MQEVPHASEAHGHVPLVGSGDDFFMYDMAISGPAMGVVFTF